MKICVLIKQVASEDSSIVINDNNTSINSENLNLVTNEPDSYALEEALRIREASSGEVVLCTMGPESAHQVIKDALAKGADRAIHILSEGNEHLSPLNLAKTITKNIKDENFDIILSGLQSNDYGYSQVGILISELLNLSHGSLVMGTEIISDEIIKVKRELENGWFQWSEMNLPTSLTIQSGINEPRYATLKGIMSVKNKTIDKINLTTDECNADNGYKVKGIYIPQKSKQTEMIDGNVDEIVERVTNILKNELKVI